MKKRINPFLARRATMTLLLLLVTTTTAWATDHLSQAPMGCIDGCTGGRLAIHVWGWTCDPYYEVWNKSVQFLNQEHWDGIERIVSPDFNSTVKRVKRAAS